MLLPENWSRRRCPNIHNNITNEWQKEKCTKATTNCFTVASELEMVKIRHFIYITLKPFSAILVNLRWI